MAFISMYNVECKAVQLVMVSSTLYSKFGFWVLCCQKSTREMSYLSTTWELRYSQYFLHWLIFGSSVKSSAEEKYFSLNCTFFGFLFHCEKCKPGNLLLLSKVIHQCNKVLHFLQESFNVEKTFVHFFYICGRESAPMLIWSNLRSK